MIGSHHSPRWQLADLCSRVTLWSPSPPHPFDTVIATVGWRRRDGVVPGGIPHRLGPPPKASVDEPSKAERANRRANACAVPVESRYGAVAVVLAARSSLPFHPCLGVESHLTLNHVRRAWRAWGPRPGPDPVSGNDPRQYGPGSRGRMPGERDCRKTNQINQPGNRAMEALPMALVSSLVDGLAD